MLYFLVFTSLGFAAWWLGALLGVAHGLFLLVGLAWVVVYYVTSAEWPIGAIGDWNLVIGLGLIGVGCVLATKWR